MRRGFQDFVETPARPHGCNAVDQRSLSPKCGSGERISRPVVLCGLGTVWEAQPIDPQQYRDSTRDETRRFLGLPRVQRQCDVAKVWITGCRPYAESQLAAHIQHGGIFLKNFTGNPLKAFGTSVSND